MTKTALVTKTSEQQSTRVFIILISIWTTSPYMRDRSCRDRVYGKPRL
jgi:hypothetical protein